MYTMCSRQLNRKDWTISGLGRGKQDNSEIVTWVTKEFRNLVSDKEKNIQEIQYANTRMDELKEEYQDFVKTKNQLENCQRDLIFTQNAIQDAEIEYKSEIEGIKDNNRVEMGEQTRLKVHSQLC